MTDQSQTNLWLSTAQRGDDVALAKLLALLHPRLRVRAEARMDATLRARLSADDLLQEVYVQVFRQIGEFEDRGPGSFGRWVFTILDHKLLDAHRAGHRGRRDVNREVPIGGGSSSGSYWDLLQHLCGDSGTPSRIVRREEALDVIADCLTALSDTHREVIQHRFVDGLSVEETAQRMNRTPGAVSALLQRALQALRMELARAGDITHGLP